VFACARQKIGRLSRNTRHRYAIHGSHRWNENDLQNKLNEFQHYFNEARGHDGIDGMPPSQKSGEESSTVISPENYHWKKHCRGLFQLPIAA